MKNNKEKRKILKVRPFNMANFSGGSGYLVFSLIYQAVAILPAMIIIWFSSLLKLPKHYGYEVIDTDKAAQRYYAVSIPICVVLIVIGIALACYSNYGTFREYWIEILFVGITPTVCLFFIMRFCHKKIVADGKSVVSMVVLSLVLMVFVLLGVLLISGLILDPILTSIADEKWYAEHGY